jgi:hypothetical protein
MSFDTASAKSLVSTSAIFDPLPKQGQAPTFALRPYEGNRAGAAFAAERNA